MGTLADFQKAIYTALRSEATLTAIVGTKIYDDVPHQKEGASTDFPFVTIGDQSMAEESASDTDVARFQMSVHAWSRAPGRLECLQILDAIRTAINWGKGYAVGSGTVVDLAYLSHETMRDQDGETYHGIIRFGGLLQLG